MHPKDVQIARISRNLQTLASTATAISNRKQQRSDNTTSSLVESASAATQPPKRSRKKGRVAVVTWDLSHNPVGRAYVLYKLLEKDWEVDLIGPIWSRFGKDLWAPLRNEKLNVRAFRCSSMEDFVPKANLLASTRKYKMVYVCKPRLPSIYLGTLIKNSSDCPMLLDIDDNELSFFTDETSASFAEISADAGKALEEPYEELATRYSQSLISEFDAITVSNIALRQKFGGHIVRHARDESKFNICPETRAAARDRLGIQSGEFALVFIGTPRPHKGIFEVAKALHEINDKSIVFHIVGGIADSRVKAQFNNYPNARIVFHGDCEFEELPFLLSAADLVPLIQDTEHAISQYQIPAKISDATALGIPVLATDTPPTRDLALLGGIDVVDSSQLADRIRHYQSQGVGGKREIRTFFLNELSSTVNRVRLGSAMGQAGESSRPSSLVLTQMLSLFEDVYREKRLCRLNMAEALSQVNPATDNMASELSNIINLSVTDRKHRPETDVAAAHQRSYDIVFFWKQNDTGIYGRRSDMVIRYLLKSGRIRKILHLDAPMSTQDIEQNFRMPLADTNSQQHQILCNLFDRQIGVGDTDYLQSRTYIMSSSPNSQILCGRPIGHQQDYVDYVRNEMAAADMLPGQTIGWFCPVIWHAPELIRKIGFGGVVSDLIDDQRGWTDQPEQLLKLERNYATTLSHSDLVFTNCAPQIQKFAEHAPAIHVVPNGAERFYQMPDRDLPPTLADLPRPIIGYVGNLRDRIDWMLLDEVVRSWRDASFVFIGPSRDGPNAMQLAEHKNVHMLGVVPYNEILAYLRGFDVGMVPHLRNKLTESMNPLKVYNYIAAGLPIVCTDVDNIEGISEGLEIASNAIEFTDALKRAAQRKPNLQDPDRIATMNNIAWDTRVDSILEKMDTVFTQPIDEIAGSF